MEETRRFTIGVDFGTLSAREGKPSEVLRKGQKQSEK